nr:hypothetical protein [Tanacetum cinerariifolium]
MGRDTIQLENALSTISQEYLLEFTSEYGIPKSLHPKLPGPADPIVEFPEGKVGVYTKFFKFANFHMDLFSLINAPKPAKVKTETCPRVIREVPLLTVTANRVIDMKDMTWATRSGEGNGRHGSPYEQKAPQKGPNKAEANAPPKVLRKDHVASDLSHSTLGGKSLAAIGIGTGSTVSTPMTQGRESSRKAVVTEDPDSKKSASFTSMVGSPGDARLDALSIDFNEELYPHMLTAIAGRRWVIGHGLRLAIMKCAESTGLRQVFVDVVSAGIAKGMRVELKYEVEHRKAKVDLAAIEAYDPEADTKYVKALHALTDLKYPLVNQLEKLKDALIDLKIPVYPEVRNPKDPWSFKEEILLEDAIAANISRAEKKKKCQVVCRTHGVGSAHHARSNDVPVSVPTIAPQGLAILLADAAT